MRRPIHPGNILRREFMTRSLSAAALARAVHVPANRIGQLIAGRRGITADTALRFGRYFSVAEYYWLELQNQYDADRTRKAIAKELSAIQPYGGAMN